MIDTKHIFSEHPDYLLDCKIFHACFKFSKFVGLGVQLVPMIASLEVKGEALAGLPPAVLLEIINCKDRFLKNPPAESRVFQPCYMAHKPACICEESFIASPMNNVYLRDHRCAMSQSRRATRDCYKACIQLCRFAVDEANLLKSLSDLSPK